MEHFDEDVSGVNEDTPDSWSPHRTRLAAGCPGCPASFSYLGKTKIRGGICLMHVFYMKIGFFSPDTPDTCRKPTADAGCSCPGCVIYPRHSLDTPDTFSRAGVRKGGAFGARTWTINQRPRRLH